MDGQTTETMTTAPATRGPIAGWIDERLPIISLFEREYIRFPVPRNLTFLWNVGAFVTVTLLILVLTGFFLTIAYTPDPASAFASVEEIDRHMNWGWLIRSVHQVGATLIFALLYIHTWRSLYYGSFKRPRELVWLTGMLLLSVVIVTGFLGYVLPWGQMSYWGAVVSSNAIAAIPGAGPGIAHWLQGGDTLGAASLHRAYAFHFLLGMLTLGVVGLHVAALHVVGSNNPTGVELPPSQMAPFHPHHTGRSLIAMLVFLLVFAILAFFFPMALTQNDNYIPANPASTPANIQPAWYFLPFYAILRAIPGIGGVILAIGSVAVLFAIPWLDSSPVRSARYRPQYRVAMFALIGDAVLLSLAGSEQTAGFWMPIARLATLWWFFHFLVLMPYLGRHERTLPVPSAPLPSAAARPAAARPLEVVR